MSTTSTIIPSLFEANQTEFYYISTTDSFDYGNGSTTKSSPLSFVSLRGLGFWCTVVAICVLGLIGNTLQFILMNDSKLSPFSYSDYMKFLSFSDTFVLAMNLLRETEIQFQLKQIVHSHIAWCKTLICSIIYPTILSPWLIVGLSLDRYVCVRFPLSRDRLCTRKKALAVCWSMVLFTAILMVPFLVLLKIKDNHCDLDVDVGFYFLALKMALSSTLPCVCIFILNVLIIVRIKQSNAFRSTFMSANADKKQDSATRPLVLVSVLALVTILPAAVTDSVYKALYLSKIDKIAIALTNDLWPLFNTIYLLNFAQNFYILIGSAKNYRQVMLSKVRPLKKSTDPNGRMTNSPAVNSVPDGINMSTVSSFTAT